MSRANRWTKQEDQQLKELWGKYGLDEIAKMMGRHRLTILYKAKQLGLRNPRGRKWTQEEIEFLKQYYPTKRAEWCAKQLNRPIRSIYTMAERYGLKVQWTYRRLDKDGYVELILGNSEKVKEHRYMFEKFLKRPLKPNEHVHHLDLSKTNNNLDNLILITPAQHNQLHNAIKQNDKEFLIRFIDELKDFDKQKYRKWLQSFLQCDIV